MSVKNISDTTTMLSHSGSSGATAESGIFRGQSVSAVFQCFATATAPTAATADVSLYGTNDDAFADAAWVLLFSTQLNSATASPASDGIAINAPWRYFKCAVSNVPAAGSVTCVINQ